MFLKTEMVSTWITLDRVTCQICLNGHHYDQREHEKWHPLVECIDLIAFIAGAVVSFLMLMHSERIDGAIQDLFTKTLQ